VASFTRGSAKATLVDDADLGKLRVPPAEASPPVEWLIDPQTEYVPFWVGRASDQLSWLPVANQLNAGAGATFTATMSV